MNTGNLKPEKVTKPIQLLAAWLLGLVLINTSFLTAASQLSSPDWGAGALIIASIANVPIFLLSLFMLQTRFRPEMQEDTYYSKYLERKYSSINEKDKDIKLQIDTDKVVKDIVSKINTTQATKDQEKEIKQILKERDLQLIKNDIGSSRTLSELYLYPDKWEELVKSWEGDDSFNKDNEQIYKYGLIKGKLSNPKSLKLTELGEKIASELELENRLWNQNHDKRNMRMK